MKNLSVRLNVIFVCIVTLILAVVGASTYLTARNDLDTQLQEKAQALEVRLQLNVPTLLWNFDEKLLDKILESEMLDHDMTGILVRSKGALVSGRVRGEGGQVQAAGKSENVPGTHYKSALEFDDDGARKPVGEVEFAVSTARRDAALRSLLLRICGQALVLNVVLVVTLSYCLRVLVFRPLLRVSEALRQIASGDADLTKRLQVTSQDEISDVAHWFNIFADRLQNIVRQVVNGANGLSRAEDVMSVGIEQSTRRAGEQSEIISAMAAAMQQMTVSIAHVSDQGGSVKELSQQSGDLALNGNSAVKKLLGEMQHIADSVNHSAARIEKLGEESGKINSVVGVIKDIADQTNLLALNAAIEAARAGEQGRGFAVVADEVRKLAERTTKSTNEIVTIVGVVQGGIQESVDCMHEGVDAVSAGLDCADQAGSVIEQLKESSARVVDAINDIALAIGEQSAASTALAKRIESIAQLSDDSNQDMMRTAESAHTVKHLVGEMHSVIGGFTA